MSDLNQQEWQPAQHATLPEEFLAIPAHIYAEDTFWPGEDRDAIQHQFSLQHPWFQQGKAWIGWIAGQARLAGFIAPDNHGNPRARFGFWETINDPVPSRRLFTALRQWAASLGATALYGPINFTTLGKFRLRLDTPTCLPFSGEPYNPHWYQHILTQLGFTVCASYKSVFDDKDAIHQRTQALLQTHPRPELQDIRLVPLTPALWKQQQKNLYQAIVQAFSSNAGWTPCSEALFNYYFNAHTIAPFCEMDSSCIALDGSDNIAGLLFSLSWHSQQTDLLKTLMVSRAYRRTRLLATLANRTFAAGTQPQAGAALFNSHGPVNKYVSRCATSPARYQHHYALFQRGTEHEFL